VWLILLATFELSMAPSHTPNTNGHGGVRSMVVSPCGHALPVRLRLRGAGLRNIATHSNGMKTAQILAICCCVASLGCNPVDLRRPYALPAPAPESPVCNLPTQFHQRNKLGPLGQGSCVHASLVNHLRWLGEFDMAGRWWQTYGDGEYASRLMSRLDAAGLSGKYYYTEKADPRFLDWCTTNRTGAILWWKPSHCCTFQGFSMGRDIMAYDRSARVQPDVQYACILDNNYPGRIEYTERTQFIRLWGGYGGFGLALMNDPTPSIPYLSYELR
jgi:hypothetical protein